MLIYYIRRSVDFVTNSVPLTSKLRGRMLRSGVREPAMRPKDNYLELGLELETPLLPIPKAEKGDEKFTYEVDIGKVDIGRIDSIVNPCTFDI